jgi:hypothetical protein
VSFIDVDAEVEKPFLLPRVVSDKGFLERNPLQVAAVEKAAILEMSDEAARNQIVEDSAALLRMLERVLVLQEDKDSGRQDFEKLKDDYGELEAANLKLENQVVDLRGKQENFAATANPSLDITC